MAPSLASLEDDFNITLEEWILVSSLMPLGGVAGALGGGYLMMLIGRKKTFIISATVTLGALLVQYFTQYTWMLYTSRILLGVSHGIARVTLPLYIAEIAQKEIRGMLSGFPVFFEFLGVACVYSAGKFLRWRNLILVAVAMIVPFFFFVWFIPESPRWYLNEGKMEKSRKALVRLRDSNYDTDDEFDEMVNHSIRRGKPQWKEFKNTLFLKPLFITTGLVFFQQMTGAYAILFYATQIFDRSKSMIDPNTCTAIIGATGLVSIIAACIITDITGRKYLLYISGILTFFCLLALSIYFHHLSTTRESSGKSWIPLLSVMMFIPSYSLGYSTIPFLIMSEILPMKFRNCIASLVTASYFVFKFIVTSAFPVSYDKLRSSACFWTYSALTLLGLLFIFLFVPETRHKSLEQIEKQMSRRRMITSLADLDDDNY